MNFFLGVGEWRRWQISACMPIRARKCTSRCIFIKLVNMAHLTRASEWICRFRLCLKYSIVWILQKHSISLEWKRTENILKVYLFQFKQLPRVLPKRGKKKLDRVPAPHKPQNAHEIARCSMFTKVTVVCASNTSIHITPKACNRKPNRWQW